MGQVLFHRWAAVGGAAATALALMAAPKVIPAAVRSVGFAESGIEADSPAASAMSRTAKSSGGGVAPMSKGGIIAACQSIGATGEISMTTQLVTAGVVGAAGAAVGGVAGALSGKKKPDSIMPRGVLNTDNDDDDDDDDDHRHQCSMSPPLVDDEEDDLPLRSQDWMAKPYSSNYMY